MARDDLHFRLRIPEDLKYRVERAARENHRSMTAEIVATLEEAYPAPADPEEAELEEILKRYSPETRRKIIKLIREGD
ncbi:Arc family DNA-binding protein [Phaeobacter italicus]|uniref:Arc family DNA-binding protein n=1 Tax=Phaeobacter italicus TaxID=481446 RepID=UPI001AD970D2|nr:Arc family DNA-binding protein [Phaeobacter italicus]MBO9441373.1 Arc family DNA-binding protein [Phaeobacter italicus]